MVNYLELPIGDRAPEVFRAVIEIPRMAPTSSSMTKSCMSSSSTATCILRSTIRETMASFHRR